VVEQEICLANLGEKSPQEVFNYVSRHLLTQGRRAFGPNLAIGCVYRNVEGLRCAAGCLIAPSEYKEEFEGNVWSVLQANGVVPRVHGELITELQKVHDGISPDKWASALAGVAKTFGLKGVK
jgi:hypothetical protein